MGQGLGVAVMAGGAGNFRVWRFCMKEGLGGNVSWKRSTTD